MNISEHQVYKMKRRIRREKKLAEKAKRALTLCCVLILGSCASVRRDDMRMVRDSVMFERKEASISERQEQTARSLFESFGWAEDRQATLIQSDSGLVFKPDGSFQMQQGTVLLRSARRQENASRSNQELGSTRRAVERSVQEEEATLSVELQERKKKKPPGGMLLIPALVMVFAFLVVVRKVIR